MAMIETACLSQDLLPGDRLLSAAWGGEWDVTVMEVHPYPDGVAVVIGRDVLRLLRDEVCSVRRYALSAEQQLRAQVRG